jgi:hypothetical protein
VPAGGSKEITEVRMYHIGLDLTGDQIRQLKGVALSRDLTVKALVAQMVEQVIQDSGNPGNTGKHKKQKETCK